MHRSLCWITKVANNWQFLIQGISLTITFSVCLPTLLYYNLCLICRATCSPYRLDKVACPRGAQGARAPPSALAQQISSSAATAIIPMRMHAQFAVQPHPWGRIPSAIPYSALHLEKLDWYSTMASNSLKRNGYRVNDRLSATTNNRTLYLSDSLSIVAFQ